MANGIIALEALSAKYRQYAGDHELNALEADSIGLNESAKTSDKLCKFYEDVADELDAAIALMRGQSEVPYGMVLMPIDPTPEMLARYEHVRSGADWQPNVFRLTKRQLARHRKAYAAMLPTPPKDTADE